MSEAKKKVIFRVKFGQKKSVLKAPGQTKVITEWYYGRIASVIIALLAIVFFITNLMTDSKPTADLEKMAELKSESSQITTADSAFSKTNTQESASSISTKPMQTPAINTSEPQVIPEKKSIQPTINLVEKLPTGVYRAQLATGMWEGEPYGEVNSPVKVNADQATGLFYFTKLDNTVGSVVYHVWQHDGKTIFRQKKHIGEHPVKTYTSKLFTMASIGLWTVSLTDADLKPLHTLQFTVVNGQ